VVCAFETIVDGVVLFDNEECVLFWNNVVEVIIGIVGVDIIGCLVVDVLFGYVDNVVVLDVDGWL